MSTEAVRAGGAAATAVGASGRARGRDGPDPDTAAGKDSFVHS